MAPAAPAPTPLCGIGPYSARRLRRRTSAPHPRQRAASPAPGVRRLDGGFAEQGTAAGGRGKVLLRPALPQTAAAANSRIPGHSSHMSVMDSHFTASWSACVSRKKIA